MNFNIVLEEIENWIFNYLDVANDYYNGNKPCPFAKKAFLNNKVKIIDYKTGSNSQMEKHKKQVDGYCKALKTMGFKEISKYIIYTEENDKIVQW